MKLRLAAVLVLLLAGSAQAQEREPAPPPQDPSIATIRGDVENGFLESISTRVVAIDGQLIFGPEKSCERHELKPGPHSLVIQYDREVRHTSFPLRIDAKAGEAYVIKWRDAGGKATIEVEDETSERVVASLEQDAESNAASGKGPRYIPPIATESDLATIRAEQLVTDGLFGEGQEGESYLFAVDGKYLPPKSTSVQVAPGPRALAVEITDNVRLDALMRVWTTFPLLLDAKAGHTYVVKHGPIGASNKSGKTTLWIEDETENVEITPRITVIMNFRNRSAVFYAGVPYDTSVSFPDKKGNRPSPKPKLWCERS